MGVTTTEFPLLGAYGLYVADTIGNGMLLFLPFLHGRVLISARKLPLQCIIGPAVRGPIKTS